MPNPTEQKVQRNFVKDGDDEYAPRRPIRRISSSAPRQPYKQCGCGGKLKLTGSTGLVGRTSAKCNRCGERSYTSHYKGKSGLVVCY